MLWTIIYLVVPALVVVTTLFGLLARGDPRPGGVALFWRVGLVTLALGGIAFYVVDRTALLPSRPEAVVGGYRGLVAAGVLLCLMGAFGSALKRKP